MQRGVIIGNKGILIVKRSETCKWLPNHWEFPGGKVDQKPTLLLQELKRELREETKLIDIDFGDIVILETTVEKPKLLQCQAENIITHYILGRLNNGNSNVIISSEHNDHLWVSDLSQVIGLTFRPYTFDILRTAFAKM